MGNLIRFLFRIRLFILFLLLEAVSLFLVVQNNSFQGVAWLNSSNAMVAETMEFNRSTTAYFNLRNQNDDLAAENARLSKALAEAQEQLSKQKLDSLKLPLEGAYKYSVARVVNNSVAQVNNHITINKGLLDGVKPGMAVISPNGVVGRVKLCSEHFSTVTSVLHSKLLVSAAIKRNHAFGSLQWRGNNPSVANLNLIARHIKPRVGDTVETSEYNTVFPAGVPVGKIKSVSIKDNETFYTIEVELSTDFSSLSYVYIVENTLKPERDKLEQETDPEAQK